MLRFFSFFFSRCVPPLSAAFSGFRPRVPWALALCAVCFVGLPFLGFQCALASFVVPAWPLGAPWWLLPPPPPFCVSLFFSLLLCAPFFFWLRAPVVSGFLWFPASGALGLGAVCCLFCWAPASRLSVRSRLFCVSRLAVGCSRVVALSPPPPLCLAVFVAAARCSVFFSSARRRFSPPAPPPPVRAWCLVLSGVAALRCPSVLRAVLWCLALLCCGLLRAVR